MGIGREKQARTVMVEGEGRSQRDADTCHFLRGRMRPAELAAAWRDVAALHMLDAEFASVFGDASDSCRCLGEGVN
jgi:hypothetical protein